MRQRRIIRKVLGNPQDDTQIVDRELLTFNMAVVQLSHLYRGEGHHWVLELGQTN